MPHIFFQPVTLEPFFWLAGLTSSNAYEPEVNPNQPSGTGYNAIESEVLPVLDLHDEACENAVTTDLEQPPVSAL